MAVALGGTEKKFDVIKDVGTGQTAGFVDALADALLFQATEERFRHGVDAPMSSKLSEVGLI